MATVTPVAKALYLCDEIMSDPARVKPHLIGILNAIRAPAFLHVLPRLGIFAQLAGGLGDVPCVVRIVSTQNRVVVYESPERIVSFGDRLQTRYFIMKLEEITVHAAGDFWVEFYCNGQFLDDALLRFLG